VPSPRPLYVCGDVQGLNPPEFRLQTKVEPDSLLVNVNAADALLLEAGGPEAIVVSGGTVSIVQVYSVALPLTPPETARTANVCEALVRPL
jgi:hypothetical protein